VKNIVVCCDGTGNEVEEGALSNVLELYRRLDTSDRQVTYYDPGLGTLPAPGLQTKLAKELTKILGLTFGYGLPTNTSQAYKFLMKHYEPGDRVFLFGFSRGAYTVRALAGMIEMCGLLKPHCENLVDYALAVHRKKSGNQWKVANRFKKYFPNHGVAKGDKLVHFVGVWDTVKSIGLFRRSLTLPHTSNMKSVAHGRHAVSLNEKRSKYRPNLWTPKHGAETSPLTKQPRFLQVWFPGVHSDVGGGYEQPGLSDVALEWMLQEARAHGLLLDPNCDARDLDPDAMGKMHNPLQLKWYLVGWWMLGWWTRTLAEQPRPLVHESVDKRRAADKKFDRKCRNQLPEDYAVVKTLTDPEVEAILSTADAEPVEDEPGGEVT
jgi:uncharacterized protein (DUF2235 family)